MVLLLDRNCKSEAPWWRFETVSSPAGTKVSANRKKKEKNFLKWQVFRQIVYTNLDISSLGKFEVQVSTASGLGETGSKAPDCVVLRVWIYDTKRRRTAINFEVRTHHCVNPQQTADKSQTSGKSRPQGAMKKVESWVSWWACPSWGSSWHPKDGTISELNLVKSLTLRAQLWIVWMACPWDLPFGE